jgi:hypothetical protein
MNRTPWISTLLVVLSSACLVGIMGCIPVDVTIRQPLVAGALDRNSVVKEHGYAERSRGLPPGAMSDSASMTRVTEQDICFDVTMHELDPIDMNTVRAKLDVSGQVPREQAQLWPEQPVQRSYPGLVPERVQTGYESYCASRAYNGVCIAWATRPMYGIVMRPGTVNVYETRARMCFPNGGFVSPRTEAVVLELVVPRPAQSFETTYNGWGWAWGPGDKRTRFAWGFIGAQKK